MTFLSFLISGISLGSIYAIIALGYTMVYGILRLINFAHGDILMLGDSHPLIETSYFRAPIEMRGLIGEMLNAGLHPILSHPERF